MFLEQDRGDSYSICVNQQLIRGTLNNAQEVDRLSTPELFFANQMSTFAPPNCTKFILMTGAHACAGLRVCVCVCVRERERERVCVCVRGRECV